MPGFISSSFFLGMAVKSTAILVVAWFVALLLHNKSAAIRHVVWTAAFAALLCLPFLSVSLPALHVRAPASLLDPALIFRASSSATLSDPASAAARQAVAAALLKPGNWPNNWGAWLILLCAGGVVVSFAQMFAAWIAIQRLRRRTKPVSLPDLPGLSRLLRVSGNVQIVEAPPGGMPFTYGLFRPAIFVPAEILASQTERRQTVLLHELAHVRRGDCATHFMARAGLSLYWWHPLVWFAWREFLKQRERAADDLVLGAGARASEYASHLLEIARSMQPPALVCSAAVAMARRSQLEGRLLAILNPGRDRRTPGRAFLLIASVLALSIAAPLAALQAQRGEQPAPTFSAAQASGSRDYLRSGVAELAKKNYAKAIDDFELAEKTDSQRVGYAEMWTAVALEAQNNPDTADAHYQTAIDAQPPDSAAAATTMEIYAEFLRREGNEEEANTMMSQALAVRKKLEAYQASLIQPSSPDVYKIGGDVKPPVLLSKIEPQYSDEARLAKYQGTALLYIEVSSDGSVRNVHILRGLGLGLDEKAIEAVKQWKFNPATKDGQPVAVTAHVEINFRLL